MVVDRDDTTVLATQARGTMRAFLESWASRGTVGLSPSAAVRLRTFNLITLAAGAFCLINVAWLLCVGRIGTPFFWVRLAALVWYSIVPLIVARQSWPFAQLASLVIANVALGITALLNGRQPGIHTLGFAMVSFPLLVLEPKRRWLILSTMALPLIVRLIFELLVPPANPGAPRGFFLLLIVQTFVLLSLPLLAFLREMTRYQTDLERTTAALRAENELRAKVEGELEIARRTEAMGHLAAGIAHEISTPLQFISDNLTFAVSSTQQLIGLIDKLDASIQASRSSPLNAELASAADHAKEQADLEYIRHQLPGGLTHALDGLQRLAEIVQSMKELGHPKHRELAPVDLNALIHNVLIVARGEYDRVADVKTELGDIPNVMCHGSEMSQVLLNLVINAAHAIAERVAGTGVRGQITVRSELAGDWVQLSVEDNGSGIPDAVTAHVFEPFFTTKAVGKGTGQGLAIAHAIVVRRHGGTLDFETEPGRGTTFRVRLPLTPMPVP